MKKILLSVFLTLFVSYTAHGASIKELTANVPEGRQPVTSLMIDNLDTPIIIHGAVLYKTLRDIGFDGGLVSMGIPIYEMNLELYETTPRRFCKQYRESCDRECRIGMGCSEALRILVQNNNRFLERIQAGVTTATARCNWDEPAQDFTVLVADMKASTQREDLLNDLIIDRLKLIMNWRIAQTNLYVANNACLLLYFDPNECYNIVRDLCDKQNQAANLYQSLYQRATQQN